MSGGSQYKRNTYGVGVAGGVVAFPLRLLRESQLVKMPFFFFVEDIFIAVA